MTSILTTFPSLLTKMSCSHEHHGHGHDGHGHDHRNDDSHLLPDESPSDILYSSIDLAQVSSLNTSSPSSSSSIIKPWHLRLDETQSLSSDADDQLVLRIPFNGACKLKGLLLKTGPGGETPTSIALFINADPPLDFGDDLDARAELKPGPGPGGGKGAPAQVIEQVAETRDVVEYPLRVARFSSVRDLTLFVRGSTGGVKSTIFCEYVMA